MTSNIYFSTSDKLIIEVKGDEAALFLNDLLTAECAQLGISDMRQACLLNPQGRIIHDMLIFRFSDTAFWLETEAAQAPVLMQKLKMYRLRRPIDIALLDGWHKLIGYCAEDDTDKPDFAPYPDWAIRDKRYIKPASDIAIWHLFFKSETDISEIQPLEPAAYHWHRLGASLPEGAAELSDARALVVEAGFHLSDAVDFKKGCYVGQEVTARTHYRGSVKKYLVAVEGQIEPDTADDEMVLSLRQEDKEIGKIVHICRAPEADGPMRAMAMIRKEALIASLLSDKTITFGGEVLTLKMQPALKTALESQPNNQG